MVGYRVSNGLGTQPFHAVSTANHLITACPIRSRDLANGCVAAEILARYFPDLVPLHSFENVSSLPLKDANWHLLLKLFRVSVGDP
jgi:CH-like domain in sperm protein